MNLEKNEVNNSVQSGYSKVVPLKKFLLYYIFTLGFYKYYWIYKSWKDIKVESNLNISPILRTIFFIIFSGSLARHSFALAKEKGYEKTFSPTIIFTLVIGFSLISSRAPEPYRWVYMLGFLPLIPILKASNFYWQKKEPNLIVKEKFSPSGIAIMVLGGIILIFSLIGTFLPDDKPTKVKITDESK